MENDILDKVMKLGPTEKEDLLERLIREVADLGSFLSGNKVVVEEINNDSKDAARKIVDRFEETLRRCETENLDLRQENRQLKQSAEEAEKSRQIIADLNAQIEQVMRDYDQAVKKTDLAMESLARLQAQWERLTSGE